MQTKIIVIVFIAWMAVLPSQAQESWTSLYNSKDLNGWEHVGPGEMVIEDGVMKTVGGMGLLWYAEQQFENVVIRVVYKGADQNNAGLFIRIPEVPTEPWMPVYKGYEIQMDDREDDYHVTGVIYSMTKAKAKPGKPGWNTMEVTLNGPRTIVHVNGVLVTDFMEGDEVPPQKETWEPKRGPRPSKGFIGLQNHGEADTVYIKEISYRDLESTGSGK